MGEASTSVAGDKDWKATITITLYNNKPPTAIFDGDVKGADVSVAWRGMMKEYRKWKHSQMSEKDRKLKIGEGGKT